MFPILYTYNAKNEIYSWKISVFKDQDSSSYIVRTEHGLKEGKKVIHEKKIDKGKGKKTIEEQAISEATSKFRNKKEKEGYVDSLKEIKSSQIVRPMLAEKFDLKQYDGKYKGFKIGYPFYMQPKYDGIRALCHYDKSQNKIRLETRNGKEISHMDHIEKSLLKLYETGILTENIILDGELYSHTLLFEIFSGLWRLKEVDEEQAKNIKEIIFCPYDFIDLNNLQIVYEDRYYFLKNKKLYDKNIEQVSTYLVNNEEQVMERYIQFMSDKFEGAIIRDPNGPYEINKRSKYLQKMKNMIDEEFKIIGFHDGFGIDKGAVIWDCITNDGKEFSATPSWPKEYRKKIFKEANKYIGKKITVKFQEYTDDGKPRFPIAKAIREDI
jgi:DNA ligase-1